MTYKIDCIRIGYGILIQYEFHDVCSVLIILRIKIRESLYSYVAGIKCKKRPGHA